MTFRGLVDFARAPAEAAVFADVRLDNREELIRLLEGIDGIDKITAGSSDAELILAAYLRWGDSCPEHLLGDFAFAIWDPRRRQLFCARDPLGLKVLHYAWAGSLLVFASEVEGVLEHPAISRRLDEVSVGDYLAGSLGEPGRTFFQSVHRLPPAHRLVATRDGGRVERWWDLDPERRTVYRRTEEYTSHFLDLFEQSVEARLRTPAGPVGVLMSGGLDSGSVAAVARRRLQGKASPELFAGSFVFERLRECDEREPILAVAAHLGMETDLVEAERFPILGDSNRPGLATPFLAWEGGFRELLRKVKGRGAQVLLTGHGGDDLMAGSPFTYADRLRRGDLRAVAEVARHAASRGRSWRWILYNYLARPLLPLTPPRAEPPAWIDPAFARRTGLKERLRASFPRRFQETARQALYERFLQTPWERVAHWYDRSAAPYGIGVRHPFLDRRLLELVFSIPPERLFRAGQSKPLLREAMAGLLPESVRLRQTRTRLGSFLDLSLRESQRGTVEALLASPMAAGLGFLDGERLRAEYRRYLEGEPSEAQRALWYAITLEIWLRHHGTFLRPGAVESRPAA